jgi:uncharacterized RDD family membrane protein YckC
MEAEYYVLEDGEKAGPFTYSELVERGMDIDTQVLTPLSDTWQSASYVHEFSEYFEANGYYFPTEGNLAGAAWRILAFVIDYMAISLIAGFIEAETGWIKLPKTITIDTAMAGQLPRGLMVILFALFAAVYILYHSLFEVSGLRATIGQRICGLKVVDEDGRRIHFLRAIFRNIGGILSCMLYCLPFLTLFLSERKQTWYERLAKTYMIRVE